MMRGIPFNPNRFNPQPKAAKVEKVHKGIAKVSEKTKARQESKKSEAIELSKYCQEWYDRHPTKSCYECGNKIMHYTKVNGHHLIGKRFQEKYNIDISCNENNLVLLCLTDHSKCETNIDHAPRTKELTEKTYKAFEKYLI